MGLYATILAVHVAAVSVWLGGMLANGLALLAVPGGGPPPASRTMRRWNRLVTTPAMVLTWAAGAAMALLGGWYAMGWLWAKLAIVLALTALHGMQGASLRRLAQGRRPPAWMGLSALAVVAAVPVVATLAVAKPF